MTTLSHLRLAALMAQRTAKPYTGNSWGAAVVSQFPAVNFGRTPEQVAQDCQRLLKLPHIYEPTKGVLSETRRYLCEKEANEILAPYGLSAVVTAGGITVEGIAI